MPRKQKDIKYDASKSVAQNAKVNGVTEGAIRVYIRNNKIDRRYEKTAIDIELCRKFYQRHHKTITSPYSFLKHWENDNYFTKKKDCPMSLATLKRHWEYISTDKIFDKVNPNKLTHNLTAEKVNANGKELMSDVLEDIPTIFKLAADADITEFSKFLLKKPEMPLVCVGSGGQSGSYLEMMYSIGGGIGRYFTPYMLSSISDEALKHSKILLMSESGNNDDIIYAANRAISSKAEWIGAYTSSTDDNKMLKRLSGTNTKVFSYQYPDNNGFLSIRGKFLKMAIVYRAFTGAHEIPLDVDLTPDNCFSYRLNKEGTKLPALNMINHFVTLYGGWGEPVAKDFESVMAEAGLASVTCSDYRNFCHGRFIFTSNHSRNSKHDIDSDVAVVMIVTPREKAIVKQLLDKVIPSQTPVILIETELDSPLATIDLLVKSNVLLAYIGEKCYGINPNSPENLSNIDKTLPINGIRFLDDLNRFGSLSYTETFADAKELKAIIDEKLAQEHQNTDSIQIAPYELWHPSKEDLYKTEKESYDASKYLCYAFRRSFDKHKEVIIPFGNMNKGFPFDIDGITIQTSESAYICGLFSDNSPEHIAIQNELIPNTNGYSAKKETRGKNEHLGRKDWESFNVEWMLYCVWKKVTGNKDFRELLLSIPYNAVIIENSSFQRVLVPNDKPSFWGCRNEDIKDFGKLADKYVKAMRASSKAEEDKIAQSLTDDYCNAGTYVGHNTMGKILMIARNCLKEGTVPEINYELLKNKNIYLLGEKVSLTPTPRLNKKVTDVSQAKAKQSKVITDAKGDRVYGIIGAIIGDIVGSRFEFSRTFPKYDFKWLGANNSFTDDGTLTIAIADAIMNRKPFNETLQEWGRKYPNAGWGGSFRRWLKGSCEVVNTSAGNGGGMRISPVGFRASSIDEALSMAKEATIPTHNSPEGIKGAQAIATATFLARQKKPKDEIKRYIEKTFGYNLDMRKEDIISMVQSLLPHQGELAEKTVPVSIIAFLNSTDYEDAIRIAITYGGDSDTIACMTGGIASAYYGVPIRLVKEASTLLPQEMLDVVNKFDGTNLTRERITPKTYHRWGNDCITVFGGGDERGESDAFIGLKYFKAGNHLEGLKKRSYTIPVIGKRLSEVKDAVARFISFAEEHDSMTFLIQKVGTSGAGFSVEQMAPLFRPLLTYNNVYLPQDYYDYLTSN